MKYTSLVHISILKITEEITHDVGIFKFLHPMIYPDDI
jgi:hypothetical protein